MRAVPQPSSGTKPAALCLAQLVHALSVWPPTSSRAHRPPPARSSCPEALCNRAHNLAHTLAHRYSGETIPTEQGHGLLHAGRTPHCGVPVSSGARYQLVLFLISEEHPDLGGRLQAIGAAAGAKGHEYKAAASVKTRDVELSCTVLERALGWNGRDVESWSQLAHNHASEGRHAEAEKCFAKAAELTGGRDFAALVGLAAQRREQEDLEGALKALLQATPPPPLGCFSRGAPIRS